MKYVFYLLISLFIMSSCSDEEKGFSLDFDTIDLNYESRKTTVKSSSENIAIAMIEEFVNDNSINKVKDFTDENGLSSYVSHKGEWYLINIKNNTFSIFIDENNTKDSRILRITLRDANEHVIFTLNQSQKNTN